MNSGMHIDAKTDKVCPETETFFDDQFFESLDMTVNALDNVAARRQVHGQPLHVSSLAAPRVWDAGNKGSRSGDRPLLDRELRLPAGPTGERHAALHDPLVPDVDRPTTYSGREIFWRNTL